MNQFTKAKENGLSREQDRKLNIIRGCVIASHLENKDKRELSEFLTDLEEYFEEEEE